MPAATRGSAAPGRATRRALEVPRVATRREQLVVGDGLAAELGRVRLAEHDATGRAQTGDRAPNRARRRDRSRAAPTPCVVRSRPHPRGPSRRSGCPPVTRPGRRPRCALVDRGGPLRARARRRARRTRRLDRPRPRCDRARIASSSRASDLLGADALGEVGHCLMAEVDHGVTPGGSRRRCRMSVGSVRFPAGNGELGPTSPMMTRAPSSSHDASATEPSPRRRTHWAGLVGRHRGRRPPSGHR